MDKLAKVVKYVFENRRIIGLLIGSTLTLAGLPEYGAYAVKIGDV